MNEKYNIVLETSMGDEKGVLELNSEGEKVDGKIISKIANGSFVGGILSGSNLKFAGKIKIKLMTINYVANCIIKGSALSGIVKTKFGDFKVTGEKV